MAENKAYITKANSLEDVEETALIPLYARALAPRLYPEMGFRDPAAEHMVELLGTDPWRFIRRDKITALGIIMREQWFDRECRNFFERHPQAQVLNLGAGLNTNYERLAVSCAGDTPRWIDVDLPGVMELRELLLGPEPGVTRLVRDLCEEGWLDGIELDTDRPVLIILEGVIMYFRPSEGEALLRNIADHFQDHNAAVEMIMDYTSPYLTMLSPWHPSLGMTKARFKWGLLGPEEVSRIAPAYHCYKDEDLMQRCGLAGWGMSSFYRVMTLGDCAYGCAAFSISPEQHA